MCKKNNIIIPWREMRFSHDKNCKQFYTKNKLNIMFEIITILSKFDQCALMWWSLSLSLVFNGHDSSSRMSLFRADSWPESYTGWPKYIVLWVQLCRNMYLYDFFAWMFYTGSPRLTLFKPLNCFSGFLFLPFSSFFFSLFCI